MNSPQSFPDTADSLPETDPTVVGEQARAWAIKLKTGYPTTDDVAAFKQWRALSPLHAQAWTQTSQDWNTLGAAAQVFQQRHPEATAKPTRQSNRRRFFLGATASAFGVLAVVGIVRPPLGLWPSWSEFGADYRTATGEQRNIQLANRVQVALNTQTSISVQTADGTPRIALIAGEAEVSTQHTPCEVLAEDSRIVMTHGAIDVRRLASGQVRLRCIEGSAQLQHPSGTVTVAAQQQLLYNRGEVGALEKISTQDDDWRQGVVVFDNLRLDDAIAEINRYRSGRVVLLNNALANRRFSANFKIDALNDAIELLQVVHNVDVRRVGEFVFLS